MIQRLIDSHWLPAVLCLIAAATHIGPALRGIRRGSNLPMAGYWLLVGLAYASRYVLDYETWRVVQRLVLLLFVANYIVYQTTYYLGDAARWIIRRLRP